MQVLAILNKNKMSDTKWDITELMRHDMFTILFASCQVATLSASSIIFSIKKAISWFIALLKLYYTRRRGKILCLQKLLSHEDIVIYNEIGILKKKVIQALQMLGKDKYIWKYIPRGEVSSKSFGPFCFLENKMYLCI